MGGPAFQGGAAAYRVTTTYSGVGVLGLPTYWQGDLGWRGRHDWGPWGRGCQGRLVQHHRRWRGGPGRRRLHDRPRHVRGRLGQAGVVEQVLRLDHLHRPHED